MTATGGMSLLQIVIPCNHALLRENSAGRCRSMEGAAAAPPATLQMVAARTRAP
jgi:hypothetical protein